MKDKEWIDNRRAELKGSLENLQQEANKIIGYLVALDDMENEEPEPQEGQEDG